MHGLSGGRLLAACLPFLFSSAALAIGRYDARNGDECRAQVEANFQAIARDMAAHGNYHGITSTWNRWRGPALEECEQMDVAERTRRMRTANERLEAAIRILRAGAGLRSEVARAIEDEHAAIAAFPHSPYRDAHVALYTQYHRYVSAPDTLHARFGGVRRVVAIERDHLPLRLYLFDNTPHRVYSVDGAVTRITP